MRLWPFGKTKGLGNQVNSQHRGGWQKILEPHAGAWQRNVEETTGDTLCYPTLYSCLSRISQDIGKLPFRVMRESEGIKTPQPIAAKFSALKKPNHYQTTLQFLVCWVLSLLTDGNTYVLRARDGAGNVIALHVLDPDRVKPLVSPSGDVFYELYGGDYGGLIPAPPSITGIDGTLVVPAADIIHDRYTTLHHPLVGVPPVCAAYWPAVKNLKILRNSASFFNNGAQASGILTAPAGMTDSDAAEIKEYWNTNFSGDNSGKVAVIGADMKYTAFSMKAIDSQMVEQMKYSDEQICQAFGISPYKIGIGQPPGGWKSDDVNVEYYGDVLSPIIEGMEALLNAGLEVPDGVTIELDTSPLWRMDEGKQAEVQSTLVSGKIKTPDEARKSLNLAPTGGGDTLWGQNQDYPLGMLADRKEWDSTMIAAPVEQPAEPEPPTEEEQARAFFGAIEKQFAEAQ